MNARDQLDYQLTMTRQRWGPIAFVFVAGFLVSIVGLARFVVWYAAAWPVALFGFFTIYFGYAMVALLFPRLWLAPRIVPYFERPLGEYGGQSTRAFRGGSQLYQQQDRLQALNAFGYGYDHYGQEVQWHDAAEGLRAIAALRAAHDLHDLQELEAVLQIAHEQNVRFSLVVRPHKRESLQGVMAMEAKSGSFW